MMKLEELLELNISRIIEINFYKDSLVELKLEKEQQIDDTKKEAYIKKKELDMNRVKRDFYNDLSTSGSAESIPSYKEKYKTSIELNDKLVKEFIEQDYCKTVEGLKHEIESIDRLMIRQ